MRRSDGEGGGLRGVLERLAWRARRDRGRSPSAILRACFGPLELDVLEVLWDRAEPASVRDLAADFPRAAYTTLMTTLDRLYKKDVLARVRAGRAYRYRPAAGRAELEARLAREAFDRMLGPGAGPAAARPVLSGLVDAVGGGDVLLLDELERIVRERRAARRRPRARSRGPR